MKKAFVLAFLAAMALSAAYEVSFLAITGNNGTVVSANISCVPGSGDGVSLALPPSFDKDTVDSMIDAYGQASERTGRSCLSTVSFSPDEGDIEGPSGGLQFYLFYYTVLSGKPYPSNFIATGQIDGNGNVYPVGGEFEKALAAKERGYGRFIARPSTIYDYYLLSTLNSTDFQIVFVSTLKDARSFLDTGRPPAFDAGYLVEMPEEINEPSPYNSSWLEKYDAWMDGDFINGVKNSKMPEELKEKYLESYNRSMELESLGYDYTAANYLFLNLASIRALNRMANGEEISRGEVDRCIAGFREFVPSYESYELYAGAVSRFERANELEFDNESNISSTEFENAYELERALLWCTLAETLYNGSAEGNSTNMEVLKAALQPRLYNISYSGDDADRARRLFIAGEYLASYYELSYFMSEDSPKPVLRGNYTTEWGSAFAGQAYYLNRTGQQSASAASLANYMEGMRYYLLEGSAGAAEGAGLDAEKNAAGAQFAKETKENGFKILTVLIAIAAVMAIAYAMAYAERARCYAYGDKRKNG
jgi:hypothetical protein